MNFRKQALKNLTEGWPATAADTPARVAQWAHAVARYMKRQGRSKADIKRFCIHYGIDYLRHIE